MNVLLFGATGMVGQGVLRECLQDPGVQRVQIVGRTPSGLQHPKLRELLHQDLWNFASVEARLSGFDACFFCLGVSAAKVSAAEYERVTYGITLAAAETLARLNPNMTFIYVSGAGTDSSEQGRTMWARVKGKTENAVLGLPFKGAYMFRPGIIEPAHGAKSKTRLYRAFYGFSKPVLPLLRWLLPNYVLTTEEVGRAMQKVARTGAPKNILESKDIRALLRR
jgi:uncharacterized protein YbjT (DUF2867 family)